MPVFPGCGVSPGFGGGPLLDVRTLPAPSPSEGDDSAPNGDAPSGPPSPPGETSVVRGPSTEVPGASLCRFQTSSSDEPAGGRAPVSRDAAGFTPLGRPTVVSRPVAGLGFASRGERGEGHQLLSESLGRGDLSFLLLLPFGADSLAFPPLPLPPPPCPPVLIWCWNSSRL